MGQQSKLPPEIKSVAVPIFENHTHELGLENVVTNAIIAEFNRRKRLKVTTSKKASAILEGVIQSIRYSPVSYGADERATERRVDLSLNIRLVESAHGKTLWNANNLSYLETYAAVQSDPVTTEFNKRNALKKIAENLAEKIHDYIFTEF